MKKKQTALARVVAPEVVSVIPSRPPDMNALLDQLVMQRVAEVFAKRDDFILEPWFQTASVAREIRRLQTVQERNAKALYFDRYGCIICETKKHIHTGGGICKSCRERVNSRLRLCERELADAYKEEKRTPRDLGELAESCLIREAKE